jgi:hypothetical protein
LVFEQYEKNKEGVFSMNANKSLVLSCVSIVSEHHNSQTFDIRMLQATESLFTSGLYGHFHPVCLQQFQQCWLENPKRASWLLNQAIEQTLQLLKAGWQEHHEWRRLSDYLSRELTQTGLTPERLSIEFGTLYEYDPEARVLKQQAQVAKVETDPQTQDRARVYQISTYYGAFITLFRSLQRTAFKDFLRVLDEMESAVVLPKEDSSRSVLVNMY